MIRDYILILLCSIFMASCDHIGSGKVKNLVDLTPKLQVEETETIKFKTSQIGKNPFNQGKVSSYKAATGKIIGKPAFAKGLMYSPDNRGYVSAYSLKEKKFIWKTDISKGALDRNFNEGGILYSNGRLYITNSSRYLVILDAATGDEIIRKEYPDIVRSKPIMATDKLLLLQTISNQLIAYDIQTSKFVWLHEGGVETISTRNQIHPVIYNNHVITSYSSGEIVYINIETGEEKWRYNLTQINDIGIPSFEPSVITTNPVIEEEYAYFATSNGKIIKMDLDNGSPAWIRNAEDIQSLSLVGNYLLITNNARQVAALSSHNGKVLWIGNLISDKDKKAKKVRTATFQAPFVVEDKAGFSINVIASNGQLYQFKPDKKGYIYPSPIIRKIKKNVQFSWISCCTGALHLITNQDIVY